MHPEKGKTILKSHIVDSLYKESTGHYKEDIALVVEIVLDAVTSALKEGRRVEIRGFGSFNIREHRCRDFINPRTGKFTRCSPKKRVVFNAGKSLRQSSE